MPAPPAPGWYPDPSSPQQERWWDGAAWSDETRPATGGAWATPKAPDDPADEPARPRWATPPTPDATTLPAGAARPPGRRRGLLVAAVVAVAVVTVVAVVGFLAVRGLGDDPSADPGGAGSSQTEGPPPSPTSSSQLASCISNDALDDEPHADEPGVLYGGGLALTRPTGLDDLGEGFDAIFGFGTDIAAAGAPAAAEGRYTTLVTLMGVSRLENTDPRRTAIALAECVTRSLYYFPPRAWDATVSDFARETTVAGGETWTTRAAVIGDGDVGLNQADQVQTLVVDTGSSDQWGVAVVITANSGGDSDDVRRDLVDALVVE